MEELLRKYTAKLPVSVMYRKAPASSKATVLLTGSTGSLGSYLLHALLSSSNMLKIYCFNRHLSAANRQAKENATRGLISKWDERVVFIHGDLSQPSLGLREEQYVKSQREVTIILRKISHLILSEVLPC